MTLPPLKVCRRIRQLFRLIGSSNANEAARAREALVTVLTKHGLTWNDVSTCIAEADAADASTAPKPASPSGAPGPGPEVNVLDLVLRLVELHIGLTPEQRMGVALWILHTHVFGRFTITPRLALLSPVRGCGKTTLLVLLELLCSDPDRTDNITAASIYHLLATREHTILVDEGDNLGLWTNNVLRAIFNAGHRRGGAIRRFVGGRSRKFPVFAPLAVAAIGTLPLPLMHRAIVVNMQRHAPGSARLLQLDEADPTFPAARAEIQKWAATCSLAREPEMPPQLHNRMADNWSVLLAIADDLGRGEEARAAAVALSAHRSDEDPGITLLTDIRAIFLALGIDRIASATLVEALLALDDGLWHDWRGPKDDRPPRKLTQSELARLLRPFEIRPRTIWPVNRAPGIRSYRGYKREWFESAWAAYCTASDTATHPSKIIPLPRSEADT
jgi:Protein of unknown function (DUF3631)